MTRPGTSFDGLVHRHLLAAMVGPDARSSVIAAQAEVGVKTNDVPMAKAPPAPYRVIT
jgi:hypothetical protein